MRLYEAGLADLYDRLSGDGREVPPRERFARCVTRRLKLAYFLSHFGCREMDAAQVAAKALSSMGLAFSDEEFDTACRVTFSRIQRNLSVMPGAREALQVVKERGLATGVVSNVVVPSFLLEEDIKSLDLARFLDIRVYSVDVGRRKPGRRIFREAIDRTGVPAAQTLFVGDRLYPDVWGASRVGMKSVLVRSALPGRWPLARPDAVIDSLEELPALLDSGRL